MLKPKTEFFFSTTTRIKIIKSVNHKKSGARVKKKGIHTIGDETRKRITQVSFREKSERRGPVETAKISKKGVDLGDHKLSKGTTGRNKKR